MISTEILLSLMPPMQPAKASRQRLRARRRGRRAFIWEEVEGILRLA
jgi:hypothetical protein